jgi:hypothetical protein
LYTLQAAAAAAVRIGEGDVPFDEQLRGLEEVVNAGKVSADYFDRRSSMWTAGPSDDAV